MTAAPELSADEQAVVDRFDAAEEPEEIRVERVAHVLWGALHGLPWSQCEFRGEANTFRLMARAAIAELEPS